MANFKNLVKKQLRESAEIKLNFSSQLINQIEKSALAIVACYRKKKKVLLCGNGGSASDAQHIAAELVSKFKFEREALPAAALTCNTSIITSIANDYGYSYVFSRQIEALGERGDILIVITTSDISSKRSGHSSNLGFAIKAAKKKRMAVIGFLSQKSQKAKEIVDFTLIVPSKETTRIQEAHITIGHIICDIVERSLFGDAEK